MVMADYGDRDRGRRRRTRRGFRRADYPHHGYRDRGDRDRENEEEEEDYPPLQSLKTPIILAKHVGEKKNNLLDVTNNHIIEKQLPSPETPTIQQQNGITMKSRDVETMKGKNVNNNSQHTISNLLANDTMPSQLYKERKPSAPVLIEGNIQLRLAPPPEMPHAMKLIDDNLNWLEAPMEMLLDQTDYLTVGVLGLQGVGKSTLLSMLAGNKPMVDEKSQIFKSQAKDVRETCSHETVGMDMYVTGERMILLDSQAMLSSSLLDCLIHQDKKYPSDYNYSENCIEMQSLQIASFMMTVCHVVLVVLDWFADANFLRFIQSAEMLKPATPTGSGQDNSHEMEHHEYFPNIVFVVNKAGSADCDLETYSAMQITLQKVFDKSKLQMKGGLNMVDSKLMPKNKSSVAPNNLNLFLLPDFREEIEKGEGVFSLIPEYRGHHSFEHSLKTLGNRLFAMPRQLLTHTMLSEKNWFHYAARTWEGVKKSTLLSEYNRLLP